MRAPRPKAALLLALLAILTAAVSSQAETAHSGALRVKFSGALNPSRLPRHGTRAVAVTIGGRVSTTDGSEPPQLRRIEIAINRFGRLDYHGLPTCRLEDIQPSTNAHALQECGRSKVGEGLFFANVAIPGQTPFPSRGKLIAFNGIEHGRPVIFAHVYGDQPVPTSYTLPLRITHRRGTFSTILTAALPHVTGKAGFITGIQLNLHRTFRYRGHRHSYLSAGCPAPEGINLAPFNLARATFVFAHRSVSSVLHRTCRPLG
jgi:hypothetical protein